MRYKIIGDSCLDLPEELKNDPHYELIPFTIMVGDQEIIDDETFDQMKFIELVKQSPECAKTACPSPEMFKKAYECEEENVFVITISGPLSGSHNSAVLAKDLYEEEHGKKNIAVIDSLSASSGETNIALFIQELCEQGLPFEEIEKKANEYRDQLKLYAVLDDLDTLKKNGRLTGFQAFFASTLNIKPIISAKDGIIVKVDQARGHRKAYQRLCDLLLKDVSDVSSRRLVITHCNAAERAQYVKEKLCSMAQFKDVLVINMNGLSTVYANDGGIIVTL